jgi:hypothetical protein
MAKVQEYTNTPQLKFSWVKLYDADSGEDLARFDCFYQATEYVVSNDCAIIHVTDRTKQGGQLWGLRKRS